MHERRIPEWLRHAPAPSVRGFAILAGVEAIARGILISVFPLAMYKALQDAKLVSEAYFLVGLASLITGLLVPVVSRFVPRRWIYVTGALFFVTGAMLAILGTPPAVVTALLLISSATVITFVCFNAYVLDYIAKIELGRCETSRMFYSALGWTIGPALGVILYKWHEAVPFMISAAAAFAMLAVFLVMRLGNGRLITKSRTTRSNALAYFPRFAAQPRLVTGWLFAVIRSCGWWVYVVYLPIFAIESGLGDQLGGIVLSITNGCLFLTPLMLIWIRRHSIRVAVRTGFFVAGSMFLIGGAASTLPWFGAASTAQWVTVLCLMIGSFFLILLDICGGLPFLLAVKPSERTEMSAIYSSFRDVSGILTPGAAWLVLLVSPIVGVFFASGATLLIAWTLARTLHPRLGQARAVPLAPAANGPATVSEPAI